MGRPQINGPLCTVMECRLSFHYYISVPVINWLVSHYCLAGSESTLQRLGGGAKAVAIGEISTVTDTFMYG